MLLGGVIKFSLARKGLATPPLPHKGDLRLAQYMCPCVPQRRGQRPCEGIGRATGSYLPWAPSSHHSHLAIGWCSYIDSFLTRTAKEHSMYPAFVKDYEGIDDTH
jgi:hypothetical protein